MVTIDPWSSKQFHRGFPSLHVRARLDIKYDIYVLIERSNIYYLDVHEHSGELVIEKGQHATNCFMPTLNPDVTHFNDITQQSWRLHPRNGMLVIFPSQVIHNVEKNLTDKERYAVAFDVFIRGTFGSYGGSNVTVK